MVDSSFRGNVEQLLASTLKGLVTLDQAPFALLHYYWGNHMERGALRMSAVQPRDISQGKAIDLFQRHLRQFGQHFSLLRWVYFLALEKKKSNESNFQVIRFEMTDGGAAIEIPEIDGLALHVKYSNTLAIRLCPASLVAEHCTNLRSDHAIKDLRKDFAVALGHAKGLLTVDALKDIAEKLVPHNLPGLNNNMDTDAKVVNFLTAVQSAYGFLTSVLPDLFTLNSNVMEFYCLFGDEDTTPPSSTLFTLSHNQNNIELNVLQNGLVTFLSSMSKNINAASDRIPNSRRFLICDKMTPFVHINGNRNEDFRKEWKNALSLLDQRFPLPKFVRWRDCVLTWITSLVCNLKAKVHEGKKLEFWLAAGDFAEVLDSGRFELISADPKHIVPVAVPENFELDDNSREDQIKLAKEKVDKLREEAVRVASKENYVWFANGRYAIFWDITSLDREPIGLLRPLDGNWEWYLEQRAKEGAQERWPELIIAFERKDGSGGVRIGSEPVVSLAEQGKRVEFVRKWIREWRAETKINAEEADKILSDLIVRIADDPDAGCSVVFTSEAPSQKFMKMGYPWGLLEPMQIEKPIDDNIRRLMEMDGATCVWFDENTQKWKVDFQFLLHGDEKTISRWIPNVKNNHKLKLRGAGARRWSAAVAASHAIVGLVVVASQDGDIYGFRKCGNCDLQMIESKRPDKLEGTTGIGNVGLLTEPTWETLIAGNAG